MDIQDVLARMQAFGLDEGEAAVYFHLSRLGPARAAAVADAAGRKRTDAYRLLDRLVEKGFAGKSLERPARYLPMPPEEALERALELRQRRTEELASTSSELAAAWPRAVGSPLAARQRFAVHQGRAQINSLVERIIDAAQEEILVAVAADGLSRLDANAMRQALQDKASAGVHVRVLAKRGRDGTLQFPDLPGVHVRHSDLPTFYQALIVDAREIVLSVAAGKGVSGPEEAVLWLNSSDMVLAQKALYDQAWAQSLSRTELSHPVPRQTRVLRGRWVRTARLREMLDSATRAVFVQAPASEVARWERQGVRQALAACTRRGVSVTLKVPAGTTMVPGATQLAGEPAFLTALVDDEALLAFPGPTEGLHDEGEWALQTSEPDLVHLATPAVVRPATTGHA